MASIDPRVDAYIDGKAAFAQPILRHLRAVVHRACPDVEETLRWSMPSFTYRGKILAQMAAFKAHAAFGFWEGAAVAGEAENRTAMGQFGRITSLADLPDEAALEALIRDATARIAAGEKTPRPPKHPKPELAMPDDFAAALAANPAAKASYDAFPPGAQRDYLEWISEAKRPETRVRRIGQAVAQLAEGKKRHWRYQTG